MNNFFKRKKEEKLKRGFGLFLSAVMVFNMLPFDQTTVSASEEQVTEIYSMETSEEDSGTKIPETDVEETVQEKTVQEETTKECLTQEQQTEEETAKEEETTKECLTQEQQAEEETVQEEETTKECLTQEQTTQEASEEIISEEMTETEDSEEEQEQDNLGASSYTVYRDCDKNGQNWELKALSNFKIVSSSTNQWSDGWYVVRGNVTFGGRIYVNGNVHLILEDGSVLEAKNNIYVHGKNRLTIYAQSNEMLRMGRLRVSVDSSDKITAGIGGRDGDSGGTITINGGLISAKGGQNGAGIGGGYGGSGGNITINEGIITATGGDEGAGIGGALGGSGGNITINGGIVMATGGYRGAGIGGGDVGNAGNITINGGRVTATGGYHGAGIGGGDRGDGGVIKINGGTVTATKGEGADDIGKGYFGNKRPYYISGGTVNGVTYYTVSFDTGVPELKVNSQLIVKGKKAQQPAAPERDGYKLTGWYKDQNYRERYDFDSEVNSAFTLYAKWEESRDYIVQVETGGEVRKYTAFSAAWDSLSGKTGTIRLLNNVTVFKTFMVNPGMDVTVTMEDDMVFKNTAADCFQVAGGSLTLSGGTVVEEASGKSVVYASSGTLRITGGNYESKAGNGLWIDKDTEVRISGGTIVALGDALRYESPRTLKEMLDTREGRCAAFYDGRGRLVTNILGKQTAKGDYTVKSAEHSFENDTCTKCGMKAAARVEIKDGGTSSYASAAQAWKALDGKTGTIKILRDVTTTEVLKVNSGMDVTVDMEEGVTYTNTDADCFQVWGGSLTLAGGTAVEEASGKSVVYAASGTLLITGGSYRSTNGNGLWVDEGVNVRFLGGTVSATNIVLRYKSPRTLKEMLDVGEDRCAAFYDGSGSLATEILDLEKSPAGSYTVKQEAEHKYGWWSGGTKHAWRCSHCGLMEGEQETCRYEWTAGSSKGVCKCGSELTVSLKGAAGLVYSGAAKKPGVTVTLGNGSILKKGYTVTYADNINAGTASVTVKGVDFEGTFKQEFVIARAKGKLTIPATSMEKTFGDAEFSLNCGKTGDGEISYASDNENVVMVSKDGKVQIKGAGTANITVSLGEGKNYTGAEDVPVTVSVAKNDRYHVDTLNRRYLNTESSTAKINIAELLPEDCGTVTYGTPAKSGKEIFETADVNESGVLSYTTKTGSAGDTGIITVTVETQNYEDITVNVNVELTDKKPISEKEGSKVSLTNTVLTYGDSLSELKFNKAEFVDSSQTIVQGSLEWKEPSKKPDAGTVSAAWVFRPDDNTYEELEGNIIITVNRAVPKVTAPSAADRVYNPVLTLAKMGLSGGSAVGVDQNSLNGAWSWKIANIVPAVDNSGYEAVFTPEDTNNYETVIVTIPVKVTKAVPYIATLPKASAIPYGNALGASTLSGGEVRHGNGAGQAGDGSGSSEPVAGVFSWEKPDTKPAISDSQTTEYAVVFVPEDTINYETAKDRIKLTVGKMECMPNKAGEVTLTANILTYGEPLSKLEFNEAVFVDGSQNRVEGTLAWKNPSETPDVGTTDAVWVFTPSDNQYETLEGSISITVRKAVPYIATLPKASAITYGDTLDASILSGGEAQHGNGAGQAGNETGSSKPVAGTFAWEEPSIKPGVSDNGAAGYAILFTPEDTANYDCARAVVALTVNKVQNAPNMPDSIMNVPNSIEKVGDIALPEGWEWQEADQDTLLEAGAAVYATAVYTGADRGNYETETAAIIIIVEQLSCDHVTGDSILYTVTGEKAPTCTEDGIGHRECTKCKAVTEAGIIVPALGHDYTGEVTKEPTASAEGEKTYTCSRCGDAYTEPIPRETPEGLWISGLASSVTYTGSAVKPEGIRVYHGSTLLREKAEYTLSYKNNTKAGTAQVIVTGKGSYKGKAIAEFTVEAVDFSTDLNISAFAATAAETGKNLKPAVTVTWNGKKLKEKKDYMLSYDTNIKSPSTEGYDVTINGTGNYKGAIVKKFRVVPKGTPLLNSAKVTGLAKSYQYPSGEAQGNADVKPTGLEEDLGKLVVKIGKTTLTKDTDYTVRIEKADAVGTGTVILEATQTGAYAGEKRISFNIVGTDLKKGSITGLEKTYPYTGEAVKPEIRVYSGKKGAGTQIPSNAYTVRYSSCINPGKATVTVTGIPEKGYSGSITAAYAIGKYDISVGKTDNSITIKIPEDIKYAKGGAKPQPIITHTESGTVRTLREGVDYTLKYSSNTSANGKNKPILKITGIGNYCGTVTEQYVITAQNLGSLTIAAADKAYNSKKKGSYYYSAPKVYDLDGKLLKQKTDYTVQYFDASTGKEIGKNDAVSNGAQIRVTVTAAEKSSYTGTLSITYNVRDAKDVRDIAKAKSDKISPQQYTGSEIKPEVSLYMQTGKTKNYLTAEDYEIIGYYNNVKKGTATVLIRGRNAYSGAKSITFKITAADNGMIWSGIFSALDTI